MERNSFILYKSQCEIIANLEGELRLKVFDSVLNFAFKNEIPEKKDQLFFALFSIFKDQIERDSYKYAEKCVKRAEAGKKGGLAKASNTKQHLANLAYNENDNENDNENENKEININTPVLKIPKPKKEKQQLTTLPENFEITSEMLEWIAVNKIDHVAERLSHFKDWATGSGKRYIDWHAVLRNALRGDWARLNGKVRAVSKSAFTGLNNSNKKEDWL